MALALAASLLGSMAWAAPASLAPALLATGQELDWRAWWDVNGPFLRPTPRIEDPAKYVEDPDSRPEPDPWARLPVGGDLQTIDKALRACVAQGSDRELAAEALLALARVGDRASDESPTVEALIRPYLDHPDPFLRDEALLATAVRCSPASTGPLLDLLQPHKGVRDRTVENPLSVRARALAVYGLGRIGAGNDEPRSGDVAFAVKQLLRSTVDDELQGACLQALAMAFLQRLVPAPERVSLPERLDLVLAFLEDTGEAPEVRASAAWALSRSVRCVDGTAAERWSASAIQRVAETLLRHASDPEAPLALRRQALLALGALGRGALPHALRTRVFEALASASRDDPESADCACIALAVLASASGTTGELPARAAACLVERLDGPEALRPWAALACGFMGWELADRGEFPKEVDALRTAVRERLVASRPDVAAYAIAAVLLGDGRAMLWVLEQLATAAPARARELALALGQAAACGPRLQVTEKELATLRAAIPSLRERMRAAGADAELLVALAHACDWLGDRTLGLDLLAGIAAAEGPARCAWIDALAVTESARAIEPLTTLLAAREQPVAVRVHAARALGELVNRVPWAATFLWDLDLTSAPPLLLDPLVR